MKPPAKTSVFRKAIFLNSVNVAALALGFIQQLAVVKCHGTTVITDFYFLLIIVPQLIINLSNSIVNSALQPFIVRRRERLGGDGEAALIAYFERRLWRGAGLLALVAFGFGVIQAIQAPAWDSARFDVLMMLACAPFLLIFGVINALFTTVLQSRRDYWPVFASLMISPFFGLACGVILAPLGAWPFVAGQSFGMTLQYFWLKKRVRPTLGGQRETQAELTTEDNKELKSKVITLLLIGLSFQFLPLIERTAAQKAGTGSVAAIALATRLGASVSPVILSGAASMLFTTFAELAAAGNSREAVFRLLRVLALLQWLFVGLILIGPITLAKLLPAIFSQPRLAQSILHVFPDYLLAGCVSAAGSITIGCYYSVFSAFRFQLYANYSSLVVYGAFLSLPLWTPIHFGLRIISMANAAYFILSVLTVTLHVALTTGRIFPWHYVLSFLILLCAWLFVRSFF